MGLFDLPIHIALNGDLYINKLSQNNGFWEGPPTSCVNHCNRPALIKKIAHVDRVVDKGSQVSQWAPRRNVQETI